jgi:DNA-binding NtrC family response regulator
MLEMRRLLLIDGNRADCGRLIPVLTGLGYALDVTGDANEARMLNERQHYAWSVIGSPLNGVDGVELFTEIREHQQRIRGLLVANRPYGPLQTAARKAGLDVISRPIDIHILIPWLSRCEGEAEGFSDGQGAPIRRKRLDEEFVGSLDEDIVRRKLSNAELIQIIRDIDYPFAGKERLEMFDRDTLTRVVLLIQRWCLTRR